MHRSILLLTFLLLSGISALAQSKPGALGISISNNTTSFPVTGIPKVFYSQLHPGLEVFRSWKLNKHERNQLWWSANAGTYYHRFIQTTIRVHPAIHYHRYLGQRFFLETSLGGGYTLAFEHMDAFELNENGQYEKRGVNARSQFHAVFSLGASCKIFKDKPSSPSIFLSLKTYVQGPFVKNYVPLLPVNSACLGVQLPILKKEKP